MKDIKTLLADIGITIPDDKTEEFNKAFIENYKTIADYTKQTSKETALKEKLATANSQLEELNKKIGEIDTEEVNTLKQQVESYEKAEKERVESEQKAIADKELTDKVLEAIGDREFVNEFTKNSVIAEVKESLSQQVGVGAKDMFEALTKDKEGIFKNPQSDAKIPPASGGTATTGADEYIAKKYSGNPFFRK